MSWYRTGTVSVTNGSKTVTGVGTLWTSAVSAGDAFALVDANLNPTDAWYEVESVTNNTTLVLKQSYAGSTGSNKQYCVFNLVGNMTTPSFAQRLATFFASFQSLIDKPTTTPTASSIPIADSGGKIDDGWIPATVARTASPTLTGTPAAPTAPKATNTTQLATTAHVKSVVADYAPLASPALTGSPTAPTQTASDDSTKIATTAHVLDRLQLYGIGVTTGVSVSNFDATDIPSGMYQVQNASGTNPGTAYGFLLVERYGPGGIKQTFTHIGTTATPRMAYRTYNNNTSTWNPWRQIFHQGNILGTVSQSDGVPTGAVIERGSNANGGYVKFADGTMICFVAFTGEVSVSAYGTTGLNYGAAEVTLPATFYLIQGGACSGQDQSRVGIFTYASSSSTTVGKAYYITSSSSVSQTSSRFIFFGRWF